MVTSPPNPEPPPLEGPPASPPDRDRAERRSFVWVAVTLTAVIVGLTGLLVLVTVLAGTPTPEPGTVAQSQAPALDLPNSGRTPTRAGDRGGWQQLALLGLLCVVFVGGAAYVVASSRRARRKADAVGAGVVRGDPPAPSAVEGAGEERQHRALDDGGGAGGREPPV